VKKLIQQCAWLGLAIGLIASPIGIAAEEPKDLAGWPSIADQLAKSRVIPGSELEHLIRQHQDFGLLHVSEKDDKIPVPLWLRVMFRKNHPELNYDVRDPMGGYPLVLKEIHEWFIHHQDLKTPDPEPTVLPSQRETTVGPNTRVSGAQTADRSESDIRINYWNANKIIAGSNNINGSGRQAQYWSTDGGNTWGNTTLALQTGDSFHSDPTVDWTSDGVAWSTTLGINSSGTVLKLRVYRSTDNGQTWTFDATPSGSQSAVDKQMMWVDHSASSTYANNIYLIWHNGSPSYVARRTSAGWQPAIQVSSTESTGTTIGADIKTNSTGDVFAFWTATGNRRIAISKSTNGGASFGTPVVIATSFDSYDIGIPSFNNRRALIYASGGAYRNGTTNNVYVAWTDLSGESGCTSSANEPGSNVSSTCKTRIWFSRSTDGGTTWGAPVKINNQAGSNDQFNQWLAVDETSGQIGIMYYDTIGDTGRKKTDVWYQISSDGGASWGAPTKVTTAMTDETVAGAESGNQYGDYNALSGNAGVFFPSWTDRRNNGNEEIWTAKLTETACTPPAAPAGLSATAVGVGRIDLSWSSVAGASEYHVLRSTVSGGPYSQIAVTTSTTYSDTGLTGGTTYYYVVRSFLSCESGDSNQASATANSGGGCTTQNLYTSGFETGTGLGGWSVGTFVSGGSTTSWRGIQTCTAQTGSKIFRYGGSSCTGNYGSNNFNYSQVNGATGVVVPAGASSTQLAFGHRRRFESGYDGGTLALALDASTTYTLVPASAITSGASYNGAVSNSCPPAGAAGISIFTGVQSTFVNTTVNLDAVCNSILGGTGGCAGHTLKIAFTAITDCSTTDDGWFLDNVTVSSCVP
jgi:hypothetical protein